VKRLLAYSVRTGRSAVGGFVGGTAVAAVAVLLGIAADKRDRQIRDYAQVGDCSCGRCVDLFGES
jgi:hypothetical protein